MAYPATILHTQSNKKKDLQQVHAVQHTPDNTTVGDTGYPNNITESAAFNGQLYITHMPVFQYSIRQHRITSVAKNLLSTRLICSADMLVLEASEGFLNVSGCASHKLNHTRIVKSEHIRVMQLHLFIICPYLVMEGA
jgi:hypothetical protein